MGGGDASGDVDGPISDFSSEDSISFDPGDDDDFFPEFEGDFLPAVFLTTNEDSYGTLSFADLSLIHISEPTRPY